MDKPFAITLDVGTSLANKTGSWRVDRPVYLDRLPPCNDGCPAGENIQGWLYYVEEGDYEQAWRRLVEDNPMPRERCARGSRLAALALLLLASVAPLVTRIL